MPDVDYAVGLAQRGVLVMTYDFPFIAHERRSPDRNEVLEQCCRAAVVAARQCRANNALFIGGKSLGGRVASEVAAAGGDEVGDVAGLVVLGYPLHSPGGTPRWRHLRDLHVPTYFVQGTRDAFGTPAELRPILAALPRGSELYEVEGGDHSFVVPVRRRVPQEQVHAAIQDDLARWIAQIAGARAAVPTRRRPRRAAPRAQVDPRTLR